MPGRRLTGELHAEIEARQPAALLISATPPGSHDTARLQLRRLRRQFPLLRIYIGRWGVPDEVANAVRFSKPVPLLSTPACRKLKMISSPSSAEPRPWKIRGLQENKQKSVRVAACFKAGLSVILGRSRRKIRPARLQKD